MFLNWAAHLLKIGYTNIYIFFKCWHYVLVITWKLDIQMFIYFLNGLLIELTHWKMKLLLKKWWRHQWLSQFSENWAANLLKSWWNSLLIELTHWKMNIAYKMVKASMIEPMCWQNGLLIELHCWIPKMGQVVLRLSSNMLKIWWSFKSIATLLTICSWVNMLKNSEAIFWLG